ncbi:unnamed protein product [Amaranthus hypochondriacus]
MTKKMNNCWWRNGFFPWRILVFIGIFQQNSIFCLSLNLEGIALLEFRNRVVNDPYGALSSWSKEHGEANPCSWFGIGCSAGHVISLNLNNLCLEGALAPELHHLLHIKSIILRNNSFSGIIPKELKNLTKLEMLDLGHNNFSEPIPHRSEFNIPILLLDNNGRSCCITSELEKHTIFSVVQDENQLTSFVKGLPYARHNYHAKDVRRRRILQHQHMLNSKSPSIQSGGTQSPDNIRSAPSSDNRGISQSPQTPIKPKGPETLSPSNLFKPPQSSPPIQKTPSKPNSNSPPPSPTPSSGTSKIPIAIGAVGGFIGLILVSFILYLIRSRTIKRATSLSQRAFVAGNDKSDGLSRDKASFLEGLPNLKRSELVTACEDFSNVIGSSSIGTIYKGTLSNGVEIAVISLAVTSAKDWSKNLETQFRKKVEVLSKVNHKNFVNIIGYCEEEEPFTRLMVFEYAPNGSLFEHLHIREAEHLDWGMRLRVAMGMAYCLEHMHQLTPPVTHPNLNSSSINLSEDYAAKISDFCFWNEVAAPRVQPITNCLTTLSTTSISPESNVYSFGLVLLEMMTGRIPHSLENNSLNDWVLEYMSGDQPLREMVDPMLRHFNVEQLDKLSEIIRKCLHSEQNRPTIKDVAAKLKEVTGISQDKAVPRFSSLWWVELDARSTNGT